MVDPNTAMARELLRAGPLRFGLYMPGLEPADAPGGGWEIMETGCGEEIDDRILRIRLRILRDVLSGEAPDLPSILGVIEERWAEMDRQLQVALRAVSSTLGAMESRWRGLAAFFEQASPDRRPISAWIWNGNGLPGRDLLAPLGPAFLLAPGRSPVVLAETLLGGVSRADDVEPPVLVFGDLSLPDDRQFLARAPRLSGLAPSFIVGCCNRLEARPAREWEASPVWIAASWAVAGLHVRHFLAGRCDSTGCGVEDGRLAGFERAEQAKGISRCLEMRSAGLVPVMSDGCGVVALGDATFPVRGRSSVSVAAVKVLAAAIRQISAHWDRKTRADRAGAHLDPRQEAAMVLRMFAERQAIQAYDTSLAGETSRGPAVRVTVTVDDSAVSTVLTFGSAAAAATVPAKAPAAAPVVVDLSEPRPVIARFGAVFLAVLERLFGGHGKGPGSGAPGRG